ncbi:hypothetical protein ACS0TY_020043 [Phlomoides rotata]
MGGDSVLAYTSSSSSEDVSLSEQDFPHESIDSSVSSGDEEGLSNILGNGSGINGMIYLNSACHLSTIDEAAERQRSKVYSEVFRSYEELQSRIGRLEGAKNKILSYTPGSWVDKKGGMDLSDYDVPNATSLLLIGPKGSGKSSLVNNISRALENDAPPSGRAQVSYNYAAGEGTCFLHEYLIPRGSGSFCLYDTRSFSTDSSENQKMLKRWMTKGVRHGELVGRKSDNMTLKARLKCKARRCFSSSQFRAVDFVIFVVNGISVLESMNSDDEKKQYSEMIASNFNNPLLSFKDDKPVVVITHGDLLSLSDRVRVRTYVGELLGVCPTRQIFDIPENNESSTTLAIYDMLTHCLDRADRNLPAKDWSMTMAKVCAIVHLLFWIVMAMFVISGFFGFHTRPYVTSSIEEVEIPSSIDDVEWAEIRHLWSD